MGWTSTYRRPGQKLTDFFIAEGLLSASPNATTRRSVLDSALVAYTEYYAAVEDLDTVTGARHVWCATIKVHMVPRGSFNFDFKDMDETMGPYMYRCPRRILDLLTPTNSKFAQEWRAANYTEIARRAAQTARRRLQQLTAAAQPAPVVAPAPLPRPAVPKQLQLFRQPPS